MLTARVTCPGCSGSVPLTAWNPGRQLRCPRCKATFRLGNQPGDAELVLAQNPVPSAQPTQSTTPTSPLPAPGRTETGAGSPAEPSLLNPGQRRKLILAVLGGLILFVGGTIGLALLVAQFESKPTGQTPPIETTQNTTGSGTTPPTSGSVSTQPVVAGPPQQPISAPVPVRRLPPELQTRVDEAIEKGVSYLQGYLNDNGTLRAQVPSHSDGLHFLVGLTLLECGVPTQDKRMLRMTDRARAYAKRRGQKQTYDLSLALLYLDRLNDPTDKPLLQHMGLQLLAGQIQGGGWSYTCGHLSSEAESQLLILLERTRPDQAEELLLRDSNGKYLDLEGKLRSEDSLTASSIKSLQVAFSKLDGIQEEMKRFPELRRVVSLRGAEKVPGNSGSGRFPLGFLLHTKGGDNSNTQFAALGLWAASRHGVPCERALALLAARFRTSQGPQGGWGYIPHAAGSPSMTCAGLLALAIGHGIRGQENTERREDAQIQAGLRLLAQQISTTPEKNGLYFLWSLERVGVLFNLEKVGDIDWYQLGSERLVSRQGNDGSWSLGIYPGAGPMTDTCFALLFLRKTNFVQDLSSKLENLLDIKGQR